MQTGSGVTFDFFDFSNGLRQLCFEPPSSTPILFSLLYNIISYEFAADYHYSNNIIRLLSRALKPGH
jgi:hypothetical protein